MKMEKEQPICAMNAVEGVMMEQRQRLVGSETRSPEGREGHGACRGSQWGGGPGPSEDLHLPLSSPASQTACRQDTSPSQLNTVPPRLAGLMRGAEPCPGLPALGTMAAYPGTTWGPSLAAVWGSVSQASQWVSGCRWEPSDVCSWQAAPGHGHTGSVWHLIPQAEGAR